MWDRNWPKCDILHICIMRKLVENCVHPFVKNPMNFMNLKGLFLEPVTLPAAPEGGTAVERAESQEQRRRKEQEERKSEGGCQREKERERNSSPGPSVVHNSPSVMRA